MGKVKAPTGKPSSVADSLKKVKGGTITKPSQNAKAKSKKLAVEVAVKKEVLKKKLEESSDSESESDSEASDSASGDDASEAASSDSDSGSDGSSDDSSSNESEAEIPAKKKVLASKSKVAAAANNDSESGSDSSSDSDNSGNSSEGEDDPAPKGQTNGTAKKTDSSDESSDNSSDEDDESDSEDLHEPGAEEKSKPKVNGTNNKTEVKPEDSDDSGEDSSDSSDNSDSNSSHPGSEIELKKEPTETANKKRKAGDDDVADSSKRTKTDSKTEQQATATLFAGNLSWNVDDDALLAPFKDIVGVVSARVVTDREGQRSRGFGYVDFESNDAAKAALEGMQGTHIDGRPINLDFTTARGNDGPSRAAERAKRRGDTVSPESDTLFIGNLPFTIEEDHVSAHFNEVANVKSLRLPTDQESGQRKGFGYITFYSTEDAKSAFNALNGSTIGEGRFARSLRLDFAAARQNDNGGRGGRGGFGGRGGGRGGRGGGGGSRGSRGGRGGRGGATTNRGGFGDFQGKKITF